MCTLCDCTLSNFLETRKNPQSNNNNNNRRRNEFFPIFLQCGSCKMERTRFYTYRFLSFSLFSSRKLRKTTYAAFSLSPCNRIGRTTGRLTANSISLDTSRFSIFNSPITSFRPDGRRRIRLHSPGLIRGYARRGGYAKIEIRWKSLWPSSGTRDFSL